jgi:dihydroceramidase
MQRLAVQSFCILVLPLPCFATVNYWDPSTATIDWCEPNYVHSPYIVEFWNTWSNLAFVVLAWKEIRTVTPRTQYGVVLLLRLMMCLGISSAFFHGTLKLYAQLADEIVMNSIVMLFNLCLAPDRSSRFIYTAMFTSLHMFYHFTLLFQLQFLGQMLMLWHTLIKECRVPWRDAAHIFAPAVVGFGTWLVDRAMCSSWGHYYGHAVWHVMTALTCWRGIVFVRRFLSAAKNPKNV